MEIPYSITVNTGEPEKVYRTIEKFFSDVKLEIEKTVGEEDRPSEFKLDVKNLCYLTPLEPQPTDDFVHMLFYREKVVATVLETRTPRNYVHFDYFLNTKPL